MILWPRYPIPQLSALSCHSAQYLWFRSEPKASLQMRYRGVSAGQMPQSPQSSLAPRGKNLCVIGEVLLEVSPQRLA